MIKDERNTPKRGAYSSLLFPIEEIKGLQLFFFIAAFLSWNVLAGQACQDFLANLNIDGTAPDPTTVYMENPASPGLGCGTENAYPSPLNLVELSSTWSGPVVCGYTGPGYRGLDQSYHAVVGGNYSVPMGGGAEVEGRALIGGDLIIDRSLYGMAESGGGSFVIGDAGDAVVVSGSVSGAGTVNLGSNNNGGTGYNLLSGGTNTLNVGNGTGDCSYKCVY
jgi:hypothetical protein